MKKPVYSTSQKSSWDKFVHSNPFSWAGHLAGMFAIEQATRGAENLSFMVVDSEGQLLAILPIFLMRCRELKFLERRILTSGTHLSGGPLLAEGMGKKREKVIINLIMECVNEIAAQEKIDEVIIEYPNIIDGQTALHHYGYLPLRRYNYKENNVVTMIKELEENEDELFNSLLKDCRRRIRQAYKQGVTFQQIKQKEQWLDCYDLNVQTLGDRAYSKKAMEIIWDEFVVPGTSIVTAILHRDKIINVEVSVCWRSWFYSWLGFNSKTESVSGAGNLITWETMLHLKRKGFKLCEVGSMEFTPGKDRNISRFKESFTGTPLYKLSGTLELRPIKRRLVELVKILKNKGSSGK